MIAKSCLARRTAHLSSSAWPTPASPYVRTARLFHPSPPIRDDAFPNHYETLDLQASASPVEIKKQFYKLSKSHHPDLHPNDPSASQRFVKISEAYAVLSAPDKKARYDRDFQRAHASSSPSSASSAAAYPSGSHSSAATPAGGRPASGLSRRRTQFRGPPPSFYRSGGWGVHAEKRRAAQADGVGGGAHAHPDQQDETSGQTAASGGGGGPGMGPGGFTRGLDDDVAHFDRAGHYQTHSEIERTRHRARRKRAVQSEEGAEGDGMGGGAGDSLVQFFVIAGVLFGSVTISVAVSRFMAAADPRKGNPAKLQGRM